MREIIHHWWVLAARAGLALALAVALFLLQAWAKFAFLDGITIPVLVMTLAIYGVTDALLVLYIGVQFPAGTPARALSVAQGMVGFGIGVLLLTMYFREAKLTWFVYLITAQAVGNGIFEIVTGFHFRRHVRDEIACFAAGLASLGFAVWLNTGFDGTTSHALDWFLLYAVLLGVSMAWFSVTLRRMKRELEQAHPRSRYDHARTVSTGQGAWRMTS